MDRYGRIPDLGSAERGPDGAAGSPGRPRRKPETNHPPGPALRRPLVLLALALYIPLLADFYQRYVPLTKNYQACLIPILGAAVILTAARFEWGTLFVIFSLPLINNLPYFFGLFEPLPQAPAALVLILFYALGLLFHRLASGRRLALDTPLSRPIAFFSGLVMISGLVTLWRYANFIPFRSDAFYELVTNVFGVTAGGAVMSLVFNALSYLAGFAVFFAVLNSCRDEAMISGSMTALLAGTILAQIFGLYQHIFDPSLGNHPISLRQGLINATFKDALAFGAYIGLTGPLLLGLSLYFRGLRRYLAVLSFVLSCYLIWFTGSKSGLLSLVIASLLFVLLASRVSREKRFSWKRTWPFAAVLALVAVVLAAALFTDFPGRGISTSVTFRKLKEIGPNIRERINTLGRMAVAMIRDYPLSGVGIGAYVIELPNYAKERGIWIYDPQSAENYLLQVASELGLIGLASILLVFWRILTVIRSGLRSRAPPRPERFIWAGAAAAVISFWLNTLSHSYIGSYEVVATFWLAVGLLFVARPSGEDCSQPIRSLPVIKYITGAALLIFGASLLISSLGSLSLESRTKKFELRQSFGFYQPETTDEGRPFRWTGKSAGLTLRVERPVIRVMLMASHPDLVRRPVRVKVFLVRELFRRKRLLGEVDFDRSHWKACEFSAAAETGQEALLLFKVSRTWNPRQETGAPDPRNLGVAVGPMEFLDEVR